MAASTRVSGGRYEFAVRKTTVTQGKKPRPARRASARAGSPRRGLLIRIAAGVAILAVVGAVIATQAGNGSDPAAAFTINAPTDGATVSSPVTLDVTLQAGSRLGSPSDGLDHLHLSLDGGQPLAEYSSSRLPLQIPPGRHTLTVELAGPDHGPLSAPQSVSFTVAE